MRRGAPMHSSSNGHFSASTLTDSNRFKPNEESQDSKEEGSLAKGDNQNNEGRNAKKTN